MGIDGVSALDGDRAAVGRRGMDVVEGRDCQESEEGQRLLEVRI